MRARVAETPAPPGILVMAYQLWHISYGVLAMAYSVMAYLVMARMRARVAETPAPPGLLVMAYQLWHVSYGILAMAC